MADDITLSAKWKDICCAVMVVRKRTDGMGSVFGENMVKYNGAKAVFMLKISGV